MMSIMQYKPNRSEDDGCLCRSDARDVHQYDVKRAQRGDTYKRVSARQATSIAKWAKEIIIDVCQKNRTHNRKIVFEYISKIKNYILHCLKRHTQYKNYQFPS